MRRCMKRINSKCIWFWGNIQLPILVTGLNDYNEKAEQQQECMNRLQSDKRVLHVVTASIFIHSFAAAPLLKIEKKNQDTKQILSADCRARGDGSLQHVSHFNTVSNRIHISTCREIRLRKQSTYWLYSRPPRLWFLSLSVCHKVGTNRTRFLLTDIYSFIHSFTVSRKSQTSLNVIS